MCGTQAEAEKASRSRQSRVEGAGGRATKSDWVVLHLGEKQVKKEDTTKPTSSLSSSSDVLTWEN